MLEPLIPVGADPDAPEMLRLRSELHEMQKDAEKFAQKASLKRKAESEVEFGDYAMAAKTFAASLAVDPQGEPRIRLRLTTRGPTVEVRSSLRPWVRPHLTPAVHEGGRSQGGSQRRRSFEC